MKTDDNQMQQIRHWQDSFLLTVNTHPEMNTITNFYGVTKVTPCLLYNASLAAHYNFMIEHIWR